MPKVIHDAGERPLVLHSEVRGPVADLSLFEQSLLFAELAMIAYNDRAEASRAAAAIGFPQATLFDNDGSQAYRFRNGHDCVIACRGTEPGEWNDIRADVNAVAVLADAVGRVHCGFKREVDDLWPMLEEILSLNRLPLWFCGHSLGGAMATLCAGRCIRSHIPSNPQALFTFGSPRVGDGAYVNYVDLAHYRWVNNNDVVTRVPPPWLGYRHLGREMYLDCEGRVRQVTGWRRVGDRLRGTILGLMRGRVDAFTDHAIHGYIRALRRAVEADRAERARWGTAAGGASGASEGKRPNSRAA